MRTLAELIRWRAQRHPDLDAIWYEGKTQTYGELDKSSSELAGGLVGNWAWCPATASPSSTRTARPIWS